MDNANYHFIFLCIYTQTCYIYRYTYTYIHTHVCMYVCSLLAAAKLLQSCPTLCDPIDGSPTGSVPGILQARTLECVAISFSNA